MSSRREFITLLGGAVRTGAADASSTRPVDTTCQKPYRSCRLANAQLTLEPSLNNALSQIGQDSRGNSNGFQSDGFRSSNPTTPASQFGLCWRCPARKKVSEMLKGDRERAVFQWVK